MIERIEIISTILATFKVDNRYIVSYDQENKNYKLFLASTGSLLAEFGKDTDNLVEHAFRDSFSEITRKITNTIDKLKYQV